jgi:hypothetical protein
MNNLRNVLQGGYIPIIACASWRVYFQQFQIWSKKTLNPRALPLISRMFTDFFVPFRANQCKSAVKGFRFGIADLFWIYNKTNETNLPAYKGEICFTPLSQPD